MHIHTHGDERVKCAVWRTALTYNLIVVWSSLVSVLTGETESGVWGVLRGGHWS